MNPNKMFMALVAGRELNAWNNFYPCRLAGGMSFGQASKGIVVGDAQNRHPPVDGSPNELRRG
jgi:hypothetical protein